MKIEINLYRFDEGTAFMDVMVNGAKTGHVSVRQGEVIEFLLRIKPDRIDADREQTPDHVMHALFGFKEAYFY